MDIEYLKKAKAEKKLTMQQLADLSKVPKRTIENLFCGRTAFPRLELIQDLERALGIDQKEKPPELSDGEKALLELFSRVPADKQEMVVEMIRVALKSQE
jgi:transcriptional regulator with XRE-family HTH domain